MIYVRIGFSYNQCGEKLQKSWGDKSKDYIKGMERGVATAFSALPGQIETVFRREGFQNPHVLRTALEINIDYNGVASDISILVGFRDTDALFHLVFGLPLSEYKLDFSGKGYPLEVGGKIYNVAAQLAADLARDGFPKEMKRSIAELAKFFEKYPPCRNLGNFSAID